LAPHLGFIYVTDLLAEDLPQILDRLRARTGIADWIGTTGIGIAANGGTPDLPVSGAAMETAEYYNVPAMAVMLADWPRDAYRLLAPMTDGSQAALDRHAAWIKARQPGLGVIHADPHQPGLPARIDLLAAASGAFLVGGLSSSRGAAPQVAGELGEDGLSGLLLDSGITVLAGLSQGCSPIGPLHRVTEADRNIIMSIDGRPALEVMKEEIGEML
jgi:small ligand-binding sensory domain FIST